MLRWFLLTIALLCFAPASAQLTTTGVGGGFGGGVAAYSGPGDIVPGAYFWVGFRGYNAADTSPAANVCLPTDTTCADLTLSSGDVVVPGSLSTCNITTVICTVKTMYNKGSVGVGLNVTQATIANRPTFRPAIAANGCPTTGKPCMLFTATAQNLGSSGNTTQSQPITFSIVFNSAAASGDMFYNGIDLYRNGANTIALYAGLSFNNTATDNAWHAMQAVYNSASSVGYVDGASATGNPGTGGISGQVVSFGAATISAAWGGYLIEAGAWPSAFNVTQQSNMNSNQHTYWGF